MSILDPLKLRAAISSQQLLSSQLITAAMDDDFSNENMVTQLFKMDQKIYNEFGITADKYDVAYALLNAGQSVEEIKRLIIKKNDNEKENTVV